MIKLETKKDDYPPKAYIQNRTNWCWVVACKILGQQYKSVYPQWNFSIMDNQSTQNRHLIQKHHQGIVTYDLNGLRIDAAGRYNHAFTVDTWQNAIVASLTGFHEAGNVKGDDEDKERGIKYVVTGSSEKNDISVITRGGYKDSISIFDQYDTQIINVIASKQYILANMVLDSGKFHTVVIIGILNDTIYLYDPWDGAVISSNITDVFHHGLKIRLGRGIVKWIQYIDT